MFDDAHHQLLVTGTAEDGFRLWCRRCDRLGDRLFVSIEAAEQHAVTLKLDIAPTCRPVERRERSA